ncbi:unnamed protein product [Clonostachys rosea f. rosea IK726]|uniref:protein-tyrosine-phosphatase n=2 Tax=Bionectria ochroleuca TaxID=29856 RepID=A0A0B7JK44_BIOOC|nr:unnamed protein product [Clonostachys rosea f. rosea IK726]
MPSAAARRVYEDQIPSFMSVFGLDEETMADRDTVTVVDPRLVGSDAKTAPTLNSHPAELTHAIAAHDPSHKHHDSTSTQMSESTESSPTTTLSTTDSSPLSDPSPSSSPDSPVSVMPLNNFPPPSFASADFPPPSFNSNFLRPTLTMPTTDPSTLERPMTSPAPRRPRNMKGLSIQPPGTIRTTTALVSEPSSPSAFIKPQIPAMKRKPSMLSLKTSSQDLHRPAMEVPPSPGMPPILQRRALKHSTSSPHMFSSMKSAAFGPVGGMRLPNMLERNESGLSEVLRPSKPGSIVVAPETTIEEEDSPIRTQLASRMGLDPFQEKENNEDQKTPGYPDGPIAIYEDNVYLYLEPTADEASRFDVVINVAKEVRNPFDMDPAKRRMVSPVGSDLSPVPNTAMTDASFATAFEYFPSDTPTTPKANPFNTPEYIHMPWDHNTDIAPDLMELCETIDKRTREGKKVLIHCQQGASRSASLIIAYGLYRNPELSVNDAYHAAQLKSQWISPNMKLMYCLQDFQKDISKRRLAPPCSFRGPRTGRSPTKHRLTLSADNIEISPKEPRTAPLPGEDQDCDQVQSAHPDSRRRGNSTPGSQAISPGPASAPPNMSWQQEVEAKHMVPPLPQVAELPQRPKIEQKPPPVANFSRKIDEVAGLIPPTPGFGPPAGFGFRFDPPSRAPPPPPPSTIMEAPEPVFATAPAPELHPAFPSEDDDLVMSPRAELMTNNPLHNYPSVAGFQFAQTTLSPTGDLFSPRASAFNRDSFPSFGRPAQVADPRSPPTRGEAPIIRSIDDIL